MHNYFSQRKIRVTLWGDRANHITESQCKDINSPIIVIVASATVKKFNGNVDKHPQII